MFLKRELLTRKTFRLPHIVKSFQHYGISSAGVQAALLSIMAFESGNFKYSINISPGVPGQGTRNMQSPKFNMEYAMSIPALSAQLAPVMTVSNLESALLSVSFGF